MYLRPDGLEDAVPTLPEALIDIQHICLRLEVRQQGQVQTDHTHLSGEDMSRRSEDDRPYSYVASAPRRGSESNPIILPVWKRSADGMYTRYPHRPTAGCCPESRQLPLKGGRQRLLAKGEGRRAGQSRATTVILKAKVGESEDKLAGQQLNPALSHRLWCDDRRR